MFSPRPSSPSNFFPDSGRVELVCGPMFAGKSTELLRRLRRFELAGKKVLIVKHAADAARSGDAEVTTHDEHKSTNAVAIPTGELCSVDTSEHDVVGIDEGQFFDADELVEFCNRSSERGAIVIIAALDGDFRRRPFPSIARMFCLAESVRASPLRRSCTARSHSPRRSSPSRARANRSRSSAPCATSAAPTRRSRSAS